MFRDGLLFHVTRNIEFFKIPAERGPQDFDAPGDGAQAPAQAAMLVVGGQDSLVPHLSRPRMDLSRRAWSSRFAMHRCHSSASVQSLSDDVCPDVRVNLFLAI
jgi:hypothetical protein